MEDDTRYSEAAIPDLDEIKVIKVFFVGGGQRTRRIFARARDFETWSAATRRRFSSGDASPDAGVCRF